MILIEPKETSLMNSANSNGNSNIEKSDDSETNGESTGGGGGGSSDSGGGGGGGETNTSSFNSLPATSSSSSSNVLLNNLKNHSSQANISNNNKENTDLNNDSNIAIINTSDMTSLEILNKCHLVLFPKKTTVCDDESCKQKVEDLLPILSGEYICFIGPSGKSNEEILVLTNYRLFLLMTDSSSYSTTTSSSSSNSAASVSSFSNEFKSFINVPIMLIESIEIREIIYIYVFLKNAKTLRLTFGSTEKTALWSQRLNSLITRLYKLEELFSFTFYSWLTNESKIDEVNDSPSSTSIKCLFSKNDQPTNLISKEFKRMKFDTKQWRISEVNKKFELCPTYPEHLIVPKSITDEQLKKIACFRSSKRFPTVVWRSKKNGAVLARSSQPNVGLLAWRLNEDELLLKAIADSCQTLISNESNLIKKDSSSSSLSSASNIQKLNQIEKASSLLLIIDARFRTVALANRVKGGGYEYSEYYTNCEIQFMNLENIHVIRSSFQSLRLLCQTINDNKLFLSQLENTKWLHHLAGIIKAACTVTSAIDQGAKPVLIHCSDGWDRTPQILALAKLLLDPYYRTISGFRNLIEVDWLQFGHKFAQRNGHCSNHNDINERCPVFLQWLDCVYQVSRQFPSAFQFNEIFLLKLCYHSYSCLFGTFLCDSIVERVNEHTDERTFSVWSYLNDKNMEIINHLYDDTFDEVLYPMSELVNMQLWHRLFCEPDITYLVKVDRQEIQNFNDSLDGTTNGALYGSSPLSDQQNLNNDLESFSDSNVNLIKLTPDSSVSSSSNNDNFKINNLLLKNAIIDHTNTTANTTNMNTTTNSQNISNNNSTANSSFNSSNLSSSLNNKKTRSYDDFSRINSIDTNSNTNISNTAVINLSNTSITASNANNPNTNSNSNNNNNNNKSNNINISNSNNNTNQRRSSEPNLLMLNDALACSYTNQSSIHLFNNNNNNNSSVKFVVDSSDNKNSNCTNNSSDSCNNNKVLLESENNNNKNELSSQMNNLNLSNEELNNDEKNEMFKSNSNKAKNEINNNNDNNENNITTNFSLENKNTPNNQAQINGNKNTLNTSSTSSSLLQMQNSTDTLVDEAQLLSKNLKAQSQSQLLSQSQLQTDNISNTKNHDSTNQSLSSLSNTNNNLNIKIDYNNKASSSASTSEIEESSSATTSTASSTIPSPSSIKNSSLFNSVSTSTSGLSEYISEHTKQHPHVIQNHHNHSYNQHRLNLLNDTIKSYFNSNFDFIFNQNQNSSPQNFAINDYHHHHNNNHNSNSNSNQIDFDFNFNFNFNSNNNSKNSKFNSNDANKKINDLNTHAHNHNHIINHDSKNGAIRKSSNSIPILNNNNNANNGHRKNFEAILKKRNSKKTIKDLIDVDGLTKIEDRSYRKIIERDEKNRREISILKDQVSKFKWLFNKLATNSWQDIPLDFPANDLSENSQSDENQSQNCYSFGNDSVCSSWDEIDESDCKLATWVPDFYVTHCQNCNQKFSYRLRKHHCRNCGLVFCYKCADYFAPIPNFNLHAPVRVCYSCKIIVEKQQKSQQIYSSTPPNSNSAKLNSLIGSSRCNQAHLDSAKYKKPDQSNNSQKVSV